MTRKTILSILTLSVASISLYGCGTPLDPDITPSGYETNKENNRKPFFDFPAGYKYTSYTDKEYKTAEDKMTPDLLLEDVNASSFSWSQFGLDLALAIDNEIGLDTQKVAINVTGDDKVLKNSLDHYIRQNLIDLDYTVTRSDEAYTVNLNVMPLESSRKFVPHETGNIGQLNEGGSTPSYISTGKTFQDIRVETIITNNENIVSKMRTSHRLSLKNPG